MANDPKKIPNKRDEFMAEMLLACYAGPYDGQYFPHTKPPIGYRKFTVRGRMVWLWKCIRVERLDFNTLSKAARAMPSQFDEETGNE
jgi:hypothetical protein